MPNRALTHKEVLKKLCGVCRRKQKGLENISPTYLGLIKKYHHADYDLTSGKFPQVICPGCKAVLRDGRRSEENGTCPKRKLPENEYTLMVLDTRVNVPGATSGDSTEKAKTTNTTLRWSETRQANPGSTRPPQSLRSRTSVKVAVARGSEACATHVMCPHLRTTR